MPRCNLKLSEFEDLDWWFDRESPAFEDLDWPLLCKFFFLADYLQALWAQKPLLRALVSKRDKDRCTTFTYTSYIRKYSARFTSATIMDRVGYTIHNTRDF